VHVYVDVKTYVCCLALSEFYACTHRVLCMYTYTYYWHATRYICVYICICIYTFIYVFVHNMYIHLHDYTCICTYMSIYAYFEPYAYTHIYITGYMFMPKKSCKIKKACEIHEASPACIAWLVHICTNDILNAWLYDWLPIIQPLYQSYNAWLQSGQDP